MVGSWLVSECVAGWEFNIAALVGVAVTGVFATAVVEFEDTKSGLRTLSFWRSDRFAFTSLLKGTAESVPSNTGRMNLGHRRTQTLRNETISRPEYFDSVSHTMEQNLDHISCVSLSPEGREGMGL